MSLPVAEARVSGQAVRARPRASRSFTAGQRLLASPAGSAALGDHLTRVRRAHRWANEHQDGWAKDVARLTGVDGDGDVMARERPVADAFAMAGLIPEPVRIADVVDTRFDATVEESS
ncbi:hypothetical protein [Streptosporangium saharense]|uniref:hypothetical protein n=1 Tax=Streptosporangium saharense TaxID=1706840 RepID=UPI003332F444